MHCPPVLPRQHVGPVMVQHFRPGDTFPGCHQGGCHPSHETTGQCFFRLLWGRPLGPSTLWPLPPAMLPNALVLPKTSMAHPYSLPTWICQGLDPALAAPKRPPLPRGTRLSLASHLSQPPASLASPIAPHQVFCLLRAGHPRRCLKSRTVSLPLWASSQCRRSSGTSP